MQPTGAAHELARRVTAPLAALDAVFAGPTQLPALTGSLRIGGPADLLGTLVLPALTPLLALHLRLVVTTGLADALLGQLLAGELDVAISAVRPSGRDIEFEPLYDEQFVLVAAPRWATRGLSDQQALADVPLLAFSPDLPIVRRYWRAVFRARIGRVAAVTVPDLRALRDLAIAGAGMSVLPTYLVRTALATGELVQLHRPTEAPRNTLYLCTRASGPSASGPSVARIDAVRGTLLNAASSW